MKRKKKTFLRYCVSSNFLYIYLFFYLCFVSLGRPPIQKPNNTINVSFSDVLSERLCVCVERSEKGKCWGGGDKRYGLFYLSLFPITSKIENKKLKKRGGGGQKKKSKYSYPPLLSIEKTKKNWEVLMSKARVTKMKGTSKLSPQIFIMFFFFILFGNPGYPEKETTRSFRL